MAQPSLWSEQQPNGPIDGARSSEAIAAPPCLSPREKGMESLPTRRAR